VAAELAAESVSSLMAVVCSSTVITGPER